MVTLFRVLSFSSALWLVATYAYSTHIRAGEIRIEKVDITVTSLTYKISVIAYTDIGSNVVFGGGEIDFGDGTVINIEEGAEFFQRQIVIDSEKQIAFNILEIEHTYQSPGNYLIHYEEKNRNAGIKNMSNSVDTPFYLESKIWIDPYLGWNNSPVFYVLPIDGAGTGVKFTHNPGAYDSDGDSLAYKLVVPKKSRYENVDDYKFPNDQKFYGGDYSKGNEAANNTPVFQIDSISGDLVWDAPGVLGEFNFAIRVEEWRRVDNEWLLIGYGLRDMQVLVEDSDNQRPKTTLPESLCIVAGKMMTEKITVSDEDGHDVRLKAYGGPFHFENDSAYFFYDEYFFEQPHTGILKWNPSIDHVRDQPYAFFFKAEDNPPYGNPFVEITHLNATVKAPPPFVLDFEVINDNNVKLEWEPYEYERAKKINVWRKVNDNSAISEEECGLEDYYSLGYELIAVLDSIRYTKGDDIIYKTSFIDNNRGVGLSDGNFCYALEAVFGGMKGGKSVPSQDVCVSISTNNPVMVNADVVTTAVNNGVVVLNWLPPNDIDVEKHPKPYKYTVEELTNAGDIENTQVLGETEALSFQHKNLNTDQKQYYYRVTAFDKKGDKIGTSTPTSTVQLQVKGKQNRIELFWSGDTSWSLRYREFPYHKIYRNNAKKGAMDEYILMDSVNVVAEGLRYIDSGKLHGFALEEGVVYSYFVETNGSYGDSEKESPLINKTQVVSSKLDTEQEILSVDKRNNTPFLVYPNPFEDWIEIQGGSGLQGITIYNYLGVVVLQQTKGSVINVSDLKSGVYLVRNNSTGEFSRVFKK